MGQCSPDGGARGWRTQAVPLSVKPAAWPYLAQLGSCVWGLKEKNGIRMTATPPQTEQNWAGKILCPPSEMATGRPSVKDVVLLLLRSGRAKQCPRSPRARLRGSMAFSPKWQQGPSSRTIVVLRDKTAGLSSWKSRKETPSSHKSLLSPQGVTGSSVFMMSEGFAQPGWVGTIDTEATPSCQFSVLTTGFKKTLGDIEYTEVCAHGNHAAQRVSHTQQHWSRSGQNVTGASRILPQAPSIRHPRGKLSSTSNTTDLFYVFALYVNGIMRCVF